MFCRSVGAHIESIVGWDDLVAVMLFEVWDGNKGLNISICTRLTLQIWPQPLRLTWLPVRSDVLRSIGWLSVYRSATKEPINVSKKLK